MPSAEIITIGTELLLGELVDTNSRFIARHLRDLGIDLYRKTTIGDNASRISQVIQQALDRCDLIITTGGLGPTVDDPTREAIAMAIGAELEYQPELWQQIVSRFRRFGRKPTSNNKRQAYIPRGSLAVENPVGTAPAFISYMGEKIIIALPGVPREMEYLLLNVIKPYLIKHFNLTGLIKTRILHTAGVGESMIDEKIQDLEALHNPTVGLAAHSGQVDIRITAKADNKKDVDTMIETVEKEIHSRLGDWIYGADDDTLERAALNAVAEKNWRLAIIEAGLDGNLLRKLTSSSIESSPDFRGVFCGGEVLTEKVSPEIIREMTTGYQILHKIEVCLGVTVIPGEDRQDIYILLSTPESTKEYSFPYGGAPEYASWWAFNHSLNLIRKIE